MARRTASRKVASLRSRTPEPTVPLQCEVYVVTSHNRTRRVSITHQDITSETRHECTVRGVYTSAITAKAAAENWLDGHDLRGWDREDWQEGGGRTWWDLIIRSQTSSKIAILTVERCMLHDVPINGHDSSADDEGGKDQAIEISSGSSDSIDDQDVDGEEHGEGRTSNGGGRRDSGNGDKLGMHDDHDGGQARNGDSEHSEQRSGSSISGTKRKRDEVSLGSRSSMTKGTPKTVRSGDEESVQSQGSMKSTPRGSHDTQSKKRQRGTDQEPATPTSDGRKSEGSETPGSGARKSERSRRPTRRLEDMLDSCSQKCQPGATD